jgi:hypothetical protein
MLIVAGFLVFGLVVAIAAFLVVREAGRIGADPPAALFDPEDAFEWVVEHLADDAAATLTPDDVRRILDVQLEYFQQAGISGNGGNGATGSPAVIGSAAQVQYILDRTAATGEPFLPEQVHAVVETQLSYLRAVGAIGPPADPGEAASPPRS